MTDAEFWGSHDLVASCLGAVVHAWNPFLQPSKHATLPDHYGQAVNSVRWTSNSKVLACGGDRGTVSLYNNGSYLGGLPGALDKNNSGGTTMDAIQCLRITKDSKRLIAGCRNKLIFVWDLKTQSIRGTISHHKASISSLFLSPDDNILASSSTAGEVLLHQMSTSNKLGQLPVEDNKNKRSLCFTPCDPNLLAAASEDGSVYVWNIKSLSLSTQLKQKHAGGAMGVQLSPSQPQLMYTCGMDKRLVVWDRRTEQEGQVATNSSAFTCLCIRDDSVHVAAGTSGGMLVVHDVRKLSTPVARLSDSSVPGVAVLEVHWKRTSSSRRSSLSAHNSIVSDSSSQRDTTAAAAIAAMAPAAVAGQLGAQSATSASSRAMVPVASRTVLSLGMTDTVNAVFSPVRSTPMATPMQLGQTPEPSPMITQMNISPIPMATLTGGVTPRVAPPHLPVPKSPRTSLTTHPSSTTTSIPGPITTSIPAAAFTAPVSTALTASKLAEANGSATSTVARRINLASALPCLGADMGNKGSSASAANSSGRQAGLAGVSAIQAGLSEEVFKAYMDSATSNMDSTLQNLHVDLLRQFTISQLQMQARFDDMAARQESLQAQVAALQSQLEQFIQVQRWNS